MPVAIRKLASLGRVSFCALIGALLLVFAAPSLATGETPSEPKPVNSEAPKLTGTPAVGQTLSCSAGGWANSPTGYTYTWVRNGSPIADQTGSTYVVQRADYEHPISCQVTASNSGGEYTIVGLPTSLYKVTFHAESEAGNYMTQYFNGQSYRGEANRVAVAAGSVRSGINATMVAGGEITGRVTNAVTHVGVVGAGACAEAEGHQEGCAVTNANGEYEISGLPSGSYSIWFHANSGNGRPGPGWSEYYDGKPSSAEASLVPVTAGSVTGGIDAETPDGQLAGRVTSAAGGSAIEGVEVCARLIRGGLLAPFLGCALTGSTGEYTILGLLSGPYEVQFVTAPAIGNYLTQYYDAKSSSSTADHVSVTSGSVTGGIDAELQAGGQITGKVTSASTHVALAGISVCANSTESNGSGSCVATNAAGEYMISGLDTGSYHVAFSVEWEGENYLPQYFDGKPLETEASPVAVTAGSVSGGIDAGMQVGGEITGEVTSASTHGALANISVCAEGSMSLSERCVHTNAAGEYAITGLPSESARVKFTRYREAGNYLSQLYAGHTTFSSANLVSVTAGGVTGAINAEMLSGGEITGRVSSAPGGAGIAGITVCAENTTGFSESFDEEFGGGETECAVTNSTGGSASAASDALTVTAPKSGFSLIKAPVLDTKRRELDFYLKITSAGKLKWSLSFKNADVGFADSLGLKKGKKCKAGFVKHKGKCVHGTVPFGRGGKSVPAGTVEIKVHVSRKALEALKAGHTLHVSGPFTLQSAQGGVPVTHTESAVVHWPKSKKRR